MMLSAGEIARRTAAGIELREEPMRARWELASLPAGDGNDVSIVFECSLRALPQPVERRMLSEALLASRATARLDDVIEHFLSPLRAGAEKLIRTGDASGWITEEGRQKLLEAVRKIASQIAFGCGIELLPPLNLEASSPSLELQRAETMRRSLAEQRIAAQLQHVQRSAQLLREFKTLRETVPNVSAGQLLRQLSEDDRGNTLQALLLASARERPTSALFAVAGTSVLRISPQTPESNCGKHDVGALVGPLRSVRVDGDSLLIGGRTGIVEWRPDAVRAFSDPSIASPLGFTRVVRWNDQLWACHSDAGLLGWDPARSETPAWCIRPAELGGSPRHLHPLDDTRMLFSAGSSFIVLKHKPQSQPSPQTISQSGTDIAAILRKQERLFLVLKDGIVEQRHLESFDLVERRKLCGSVTAAALLPWLGESRLLIGTSEGPIFCVGWDDQLLSQFSSEYGSVIAITAGPDVIAALTADRQRILIWDAWEGRNPRAVLHIPSLARHRAADLAI